MAQKSVNINLEYSREVYEELQAFAEKDGYITIGDNISCSKAVKAFIHTLLYVDNMPAVADMKAREGSTTMDIMRRGTHQYVKSQRPTEKED